jgi:chromosomal replication initiator protein
MRNGNAVREGLMTTDHAASGTREFKTALDLVKRRVSRQQYDTWFQRVGFLGADGDTWTVGVPNRFFQDWMTKKFRALLAQAALEAAGRRVDVRFEVGPDSPAAAAADPRRAEARRDGSGLVREASTSLVRPGGPAAKSPPPRPAAERPATTSPLPPAPPASPGDFPLASRPTPGSGATASAPPTVASTDSGALQLQPTYTFENFVIGPSNQMAHAKAKAVADDPGGTNNPLFLYGSVGLGKTHLLQAICHEVLRRSPGFRIVYLSCEQFTNEYVSALQRNATEAFRNRFRSVDMLVIDDIHFLANKERTQEEVFHTFNALYQARKQVILSSDAPPSDIPSLQERLVSRFKWGLVEKLEQPETETRMAIIRRKAEFWGLALPDDVVEYVAVNVRNNIREIEGALQSIRSRAQIQQVQVDLGLAKAALEATLSHEPQAVGLDRITQVVATHFGVKVSDLRSKKRTKSVSLPRQIVMWIARAETPLSLEEIGNHFGGRDHTTVLYATEKVGDLVAADESFKAQVERLRDRLRTH